MTLEGSRLQQLRRSLIMAPPNGPATAITNQQAADLIAELQQARRRLTHDESVHL